jgi:hypothetical protein
MYLVLGLLLTILQHAEAHPAPGSNFLSIGQFTDTTDIAVLEPWTYHDDFQDRDLGAWASYPLWQDIAYNQNFRVNQIIPGDSNISIVQKVTPYTAVDNYAGAQKLLDMYLVPGAKIRFRYYLKTHQPSSWVKVRLAAGDYGKLDLTIKDPKINEWQWVTLNFEDFVKANPIIAGRNVVKIHAMAVLTKFPEADPDMPIYLGLDDISFEGARPYAFKFISPEMHKLPEFAQYIPKQHFSTGSLLDLEGKWAPEVKRVQLEIVLFTNQDKVLFQSWLDKKDDTWLLHEIPLNFEKGLYLGRLSGYDHHNKISETPFTIHLAPQEMAGKHPRLVFDGDTKKAIVKRLKQERFQKVNEYISETAKQLRAKIPPESLHFDLDQFPDEEWLPTWDAWGSRIYHTGAALRLNARAYALQNDLEAGNYTKEVLLRLASWPNWTHPWQTKRGRYSEHRTGDWSHRVAEAYDLVYELMSTEEQHQVRTAIFNNIVKGVHRTYIYNDNITAATSNWLAMTVGGSLMCQSAIFEDGESAQNLEPYFTGAILKLDRFLNRVTDSKDGAWGEGYGYNNYSFSNLSYSLPSLENVFNIDLSKPLVGTYNEYIWGGLIKKKRWFEYGDSKGNLTSASNWAFLLNKYKEPRLSWFYHFLNQQNNTYEDVLFDVATIPQNDPFSEPPVKLFRDLGTTVFKSGWEADDFVFVMRTGPAYNHQHLDQGSFWLADRGEIFVAERPLGNSHYYDDPIYESWLTQPVGHSTILINGNHQSQRVGDHLNFAPGFNDYAFVSHFLDGKEASFSTGDIGRLYWGEVDGLTRNVLYLKPRTILLLDVVTPSEKPAKATLLFQTERLEDLTPGAKRSAITKGGHSMHVFHLSPVDHKVEAVETPHYLKTLQNTRPLIREGMLTVSANTQGEPLVIANLITTSPSQQAPPVAFTTEEHHIKGTSSGQNFAFTTTPGMRYSAGDFTTNALAVSWSKGLTFLAKATYYQGQGATIISEAPITLEFSQATGDLKFYLESAGNISITRNNKPTTVSLNGAPVQNYTFAEDEQSLVIPLPAGEGIISIK